MTVDYDKYYNLENYLLTDVKKFFDENKYLTAFDFFCIIIWKANRAKTKIANRLFEMDSDIEKTIKDLTEKIYYAEDDKRRLQILFVEYKFRLPMSSAILAILYPDTFTVYDVRVCETLTEFKKLGNIINFERLWSGYQGYIESVRNIKPEHFSLREKDRFLWGKSFYEQLNNDIKNRFSK